MKIGKHFITAVDIGTTHIKAAVFDETYQEIVIVKKSTPIGRDDWGQIYDPQAFFVIVKELIENLWNQLKEWYPDGFCLEGIAITGMAEAGLIVEQGSGKELTDILPWFDRRTVALSETEAAREEEHFYETGLRNSYKYGVFKYRWLLKNKGISPKNTVWLSVCDYIAMKLTGQFVTDPSFAARTYAYHIYEGSWREGVLTPLGLHEGNFPRVIPSGECGGVLVEPKLRAFVSGELPVSVCGHDHICAMYGLISGEENVICDSLGTAESFTGVLGKRKLGEEEFRSGLVYGPYVNSSKLFWLGNISSAGQSLEWYLKLLGGQYTYEDVSRALVKLEPEGPGEILYYPYLAGMGTPYFRPELPAAFLGLRQDHGWEHVLKGIIEGVTYQGKWILESYLRNTKAVLCAGGASDCVPWMQLKADVYGIRVMVSKVTEATLMGAAKLMRDKMKEEKTQSYCEQRADVSAFGERKEGCLSQEAACYVPDAERSRLYQKAYERYRKNFGSVERMV